MHGGLALLRGQRCEVRDGFEEELFTVRAVHVEKRRARPAHHAERIDQCFARGLVGQTADDDLRRRVREDVQGAPRRGAEAVSSGAA